MDSNGVPVEFLVVHCAGGGRESRWVAFSRTIPEWEGWSLCAYTWEGPVASPVVFWVRPGDDLGALRTVGVTDMPVRRQSVVRATSNCVHRLGWKGDCCTWLAGAVLGEGRAGLLLGVRSRRRGSVRLVGGPADQPW